MRHEPDWRVILAGGVIVIFVAAIAWGTVILFGVGVLKLVGVL